MTLHARGPPLAWSAQKGPRVRGAAEPDREEDCSIDGWGGGASNQMAIVGVMVKQ